MAFGFWLYLRRPSLFGCRKEQALDAPTVLTLANQERCSGFIERLSLFRAEVAFDPASFERLAIGQPATLSIPVQRANLAGADVVVTNIRSASSPAVGDASNGGRPQTAILSFRALALHQALAIEQLLRSGRRLRRVTVAWPVRVSLGEHRFFSTTLDATEAGLCVAAGPLSAVFRPGDKVKVHLELPDGAVIDAMAEVVAAARPGTLPLRLLATEAHAHARLRACLAGVQDKSALQGEREQLLLTGGRG